MPSTGVRRATRLLWDVNKEGRIASGTQNKFFKAVALAKKGETRKAVDVYKEFRNCATMDKRVALEEKFNKGEWGNLSLYIKLTKFMK